MCKLLNVTSRERGLRADLLVPIRVQRCVHGGCLRSYKALSTSRVVWECSSKRVVDGLITSPVQVPANALLLILAFLLRSFLIGPRSIHDVLEDHDLWVIHLQICLDRKKRISRLTFL
jgi:hypothetical protein